MFFLIFTVSERVNERRRGAKAHVEVDQFRVQLQHVVSHQSVAVRPGNTLCLVRDYNTLDHVSKALELTNTGKTDLVVMTVHLLRGPDTGYQDLAEHRVFTEYEQLLFSRVVALAEKAGKHVELLVVPSSDIFQAIAQTAAQLHSSMIIAGVSSVVTPEEQARRLGQAWERLTQKPKHQVCFRIIKPNGRMRDFYLGAHAPQMSEEDVNLVHELWLRTTSQPGWEHLHHKDIVSVALALLKQDCKSQEQEALLEHMRRDLLRQQTPESAVQVKSHEKGGKRS